MRLWRTGAVLALACLLSSLAPSVGASNDSFYGRQWGLKKVQAPSAWGGSTGAGITVAVLDTGADLDHPDLAPRLVGGRNFVEDGQPPEDDNGHGTHVSGIVGAVTGNGLGVASMAPDVRIMPVRVLADEDGEPGGDATGTSSDVSAGIRWAADNGAHVINLSLGQNVIITNVLGSSIEDAISYAWSKGVVCVLAAGNDFIFPSGYGQNTDAIVVSATNRSDGKSVYSNDVGNAKWGMAAPGDDILSTWVGNKYAEASGTSMAAPHVAGGAALVRALGASPKKTVDTLLSTADDVGPSGRDSTFGSGRLNAAGAVAAVGGQPAPTDGGAGSSSPPPTSDGGSGSQGSSSSPRVLSDDRTPRPAAPTSGGDEQPGDDEVVDAAGETEALASPTPAFAAPGDSSSSTSTLPWVLLGMAGALLAVAGGFLYVRVRR